MRKRMWMIVVIVCLGMLPLLAMDIQLSGMLRTKFAAALDSGEFLLADQEFHTTLDGYGETSGFHVSPVAVVSVAGEVCISIQEAYIDFHLDRTDIRIGKQAVVWGTAEGFFISDIVSPQDLSFFILADFSDIRIGIPAVRVQNYFDRLSIDVVWLPFFVPTVFPDQDSVWYTQAMSLIEPYDIRMEGLSDGEVFAKLSYFGSGFDAELMAGYARDDQPVLEGAMPQAETCYKRFTVIGASFSKPFGAVLARSEAATYFDRAFTTQEIATEFGITQKNELVFLGGIDWSMGGIDFSVQYVGQYIFDYDQTLVQPEYRQTASVRIHDTVLSDYLTLEMFAYIGLDPFDALLRPSVSYTIEDGVLLKVGTDIFFGDSSGQYGQYRDNSLVSVSLSCYF